MVPGTYKARAVEAVLAQTEKGKEYVGVTFEVVDGEFKGSSITTQLWWTPAAEDYTRANLKKLGWDNGVKNVDGHAHLTVSDAPIAIGVKSEEYNGKTSLKVDWMVSPPSGVRESDKLSGKQAADLLARIKGQRVNGARTSPREEYGPGADDF